MRIGLLFYYKKIEAFYIENIPNNKAIIFLSNHQNALLDPLLITIKSKRKNYFLTRADAFSNPIIAFLLKSLQMLPVYRMRDGFKTIIKNLEIFTICSELLNKKQSIMLFPEGNHSLNRSVRNLSKGFTRIIKESFDKFPEIDLVLIPVGLNYQSPKDFGDNVSIYFGSHIYPSSYLNMDKTFDILSLKKDLYSELKKLTTHIEINEKYESSLNKLNSLHVDFTDPKTVNNSIENNFEYTGRLAKPTSKIYFIIKILLIIIYSIPYWVWKKIMVPKIEDDEFIGSLRFAIIITIAPCFLICEILTATLFLGPIYGLLLFLLGVFTPLLALKLK